jgi:hypothetical protein
VGPKTFVVQATDGYANASASGVSYSVVYAFGGLLRPIDPPPTLNSARAGRAVPVKFSLGGYQGLSIFEPAFPASRQTACSDSAPIGPIESTATAGGSGLTYDPATNTYGYIWKTRTDWAGTCRQLLVRLDDGSEYAALFAFN